LSQRAALYVGCVGAPIGDPFTGHDDPVWSVALGQLKGRQHIAG
jgi:hypothetical protein